MKHDQLTPWKASTLHLQNTYNIHKKNHPRRVQRAFAQTIEFYLEGFYPNLHPLDPWIYFQFCRMTEG